MKHIYIIVILLISFSSISHAINPENQYNQAIENRDFTIVLTDLVKQSSKSNKNDSRIFNDCYITVLGSKATLRLDPRLSTLLAYLEDNNSSIKKVSKSKSKNNVYILTIHSDRGFQNLSIRITLYKDSKDCYVQLITEKNKGEMYAFKGYLSIPNN